MTKEARKYNEKDIISSSSGMGKLDNFMQITEIRILPYTIYKKINSKWFTGLNIRQDIIKLLKESVGKIFTVINCSNIFSDQSPKAKKNKSKNKQVGPNQT